MKRFKSFDGPTEEEWVELVSCGKKFDVGAIVEYAGGKLWEIMELMYEDERYTPTEYVYRLKNLETGDVAVGTSQFMNPAGTFVDYDAER